MTVEPTGSAASVDGGVDLVQLSIALGLAGKWMAEVQQAGGGAAVLEYLKRAAHCLSEGGGTDPAGSRSDGSEGCSGSRSVDLIRRDRVSCKLLYRLAQYADQRYKETVLQKSSPEFARQVKYGCGGWEKAFRIYPLIIPPTPLCTKARTMELKRQQVLDLKAKISDPTSNEQVCNEASGGCGMGQPLIPLPGGCGLG